MNYLTHNLYSYPAKFIPHVPYYVISKYMKKKNRVILDPFAGSSSTVVEALHMGHNSICIDLNPLTNFLTKVKTQRLDFMLVNKNSLTLNSFLKENKSGIQASVKVDLQEFIVSMKASNETFYPNWENIDHWYPEEFKYIISNMWGFIYSVENVYPESFINLVKLTALYISRYLSYGARDIPKLFRSKRRIEQVKKLRKKVKNDPNLPYEVFQKKLLHNYKQMLNLTRILEKENLTPEYEFELTKDNIRNQDESKKKIICLGNTDISTFTSPIDGEFVDLIVTSPPYIYAQEYMRSTKLDLYWLNLINDTKVRELTKKELGTKKNTDTHTIKEKLKSINSFITITEILDRKEKKKYGKPNKYTVMTYNYFYDMYRIISKIYRYIKQDGIFALFIGNPTVLGNQIPCHAIFSEFFLDLGMRIEEFGYDEILSPRLLKGRQNESPDGMNAEWLIVARKNRKETRKK
ncbi:MAG: DNA methyltransferase [Candidatus Hodarchaeota archaeon]